ncbi:MAG: hypothetical protein K0S23_3602 [Fluviicola sp.]|jgi:hypothetical protein|uniref:DUF6495 family protein n=1 Tax=Fluviicola sp. TaxID=1917219 RepID=UPI002634E58E|nr:DUF6495 family protein [Fluviicola sp.]MDF3029295.1 hypothetical protein [Fluviicola sp.]
MKYRILTDEELQHLEGDLKAFLIINGIHGDEWEKLNREEPQKAVELVGLFSDQVLQTVYEKVRFLEHRSPDSCLVFHFGEEEQELIAIQKKPETKIDLSTINGIHEALTKAPTDLSFFTSKKDYTDSREMEIHQLIQQGAVLSDANFWNSLKEIL